jgi:RNA polymerase subunit RPABC4/transcription elongation factor Spt4
MQCPSCQAVVAEGAKFCMGCGVPLPHACPACGHVMPATAKFCPRCGAKADRASAPSSLPSGPTPSAHPAPVASAERRQLTVMFCDGSTALAARLVSDVCCYHSCPP